MNLRQAARILDQGRLDRQNALRLYKEADLLSLGQLAHALRLRLHPKPIVTYSVDRNINYTNVCVSGCAFCAFWRSRGEQEAYELDLETLRSKCQETLDLGGTHVLYQGGLNPQLDFSWHEQRLRLMRRMGLWVHGFSPPEILFMAESWGLSIRDLLQRLVDAGLCSIPGGGAEILVDRVRKKVSPAKGSSAKWLEVMREAHLLGLRTTATMMFGHIETLEERLEHMLEVRNLQDETGGFTAFIPWPYQPGKNTLQAPKAGAVAYLRTLAVSRLVLDNIPHIQASWVTQGPEVGQVALHFGADDLGSTMIEENVVASAGVSFRLCEKEMKELILRAGFQPRKRDVLYRPA